MYYRCFSPYKKRMRFIILILRLVNDSINQNSKELFKLMFSEIEQAEKKLMILIQREQNNVKIRSLRWRWYHKSKNTSRLWGRYHHFYEPSSFDFGLFCSPVSYFLKTPRAITCSSGFFDNIYTRRLLIPERRENQSSSSSEMCAM